MREGRTAVNCAYSPKYLEVGVFSEAYIQHTHPPITSRIGVGS